MKTKRLLSILLSLVLVLGLMPGMSLTAYADPSGTYREYSWNDSTKALSYEDKAIPTDENVVEITSSNVPTAWENGKTYVVTETASTSTRITVSGTVNLILCDGMTLTASEGINVAENNTLNIYGQSGGTGMLEANGTGIRAGIGGGAGSTKQKCGAVNIHGGVVNATGNSDGAGIGSSSLYNAGSSLEKKPSGGTVTIYNGTVTATAGNDSTAAGIGGGRYGGGGTVYVYGGTVNATGGGSSGAGIGGASYCDGGNVYIYGGTVIATGKQGSSGIGGGNSGGNGGSVYIYGGTVIATSEWGKAGIGQGNNMASSDGTLTLGDGVSMLVSSDNSNWSAYDGSTRARYMKTGEAAPAHTSVTWDADQTIENTQTISVGVTVVSDITVTVSSGVVLTVNGGINADGKTVTVAGEGTLIINGATGSNGVDAEGEAGDYGFAGNIIVDGATVTVTGGTGGIGGSDGESYTGCSGGSGGNGVVGNVTVNSGSIEVTGGTGGNGGGGDDYGGNGGNGGIGVNGTVTVTGGSATLAGGTGGNGGYGFDGGNGGNGGIGVNGTVTVTGGSATLAGGTGGEAGAGNSSYGENGVNGGKGEAVSGTITGSAEESDDNSNWAAVSGSTSAKQYVRITPAHTHNFTYFVSGATITAECSAEGCTLPEVSGKHTATLTIGAPALTTYGGIGDATATITDANSIKGTATVQYQTKSGSAYGEATTTAPTEAGSHKASITLGTATASVEYTIAKADSTLTAPTASAIYGQTLADITLTNPNGNTAGTWAWAVDTSTSVGNVGTNTFKANFTPTDADNYNAVSNVDVTVAVGKAANPAAVTGTASVTKGGNTVDLANNVTKNGATGDVTYAISGEANGCSLNGSVLTSGDNTGSVTVNVTVAEDDNYKALAATPITVTISDKATQTITASGVTATFGDTNKSVSAETNGNGAISYAVKDGSADYIDVDASTGALTIKAVPADGKAYVTVTAAETATYAQATKDVAINISKATAVAATVTANSRTYDGTDKVLVNVTGAAVGGEMKYAQGENSTTAPAIEYETAVPTQAAIGTYYVWFKVIGDENHNDSNPACVTVTISAPVYSDDEGSSAPAAATVTIPVSGEDESVNVTVTVSDNTATVTGADVDKVLEAEDVGTVTVDVSKLNNNVNEAVIPGAMVDKIVGAVLDESNNADGLEVKLPTGSVSFDADAVAAISEKTDGKDLTLHLDDVKVTELNTAQQSAVNDIQVEVVLDAYLTSGGQRISDFNGGSATVKIPYTLKDGQTAAGLVVWYVASDGTRTMMPARYVNNEIVFTVPHFSNYVVAYDAERAKECPKDSGCPMSAFTDLKLTEWYHDGVHYCIENGLMAGYGNGIFGPNDTISRAMIVTILYRMENEPNVTSVNPFSDVAAGQWYTNAVTWAAENKIVEGYGDGTFKPNKDVTREELAAILYRYAQSKGKGFSGAWMFLLDYPDASEVSSWADEAMHWMVMNEIIKGKEGKLVPGGDASRAEAATMLMRYCTKIAE